MASWKKVVVSGSNAELAQITSSGLDATRVVFTGTGGALTGSGGLTYTHSTEQLTATKIVNNSAVSDSRLTGSMSGSFVGTFANSDGSTVGAQTLQQTMALGSTTSVAITSSKDVMLSGSGAIFTGAIKSTGSFNMDIQTGEFTVQNSDEPTDIFKIDGNNNRIIIDPDGVGTAMRINTNSQIANAGVSIATDIGTNNSLTLGVGLNNTDSALRVTGSANISGEIIAKRISGSFSGSFEGDGSGLTGITAEWDGSINGNAEITGSLTVSASAAQGGGGITSTGVISGSSLSADLTKNHVLFAGTNGVIAGDAGMTYAQSTDKLSVTHVSSTSLTASAGILAEDFDVIDAQNVTIFDNVGNFELKIGATNTTVNIPGDRIELGNSTGDIVDIKGDLRVAGTSSFTNATNLSVADKYILLNSGSAGANLDSGGIVIQGPNQNVGQLFGYISGSSVDSDGLNRRWGIASNFNASASGDFSPNAFMATVAVDTAASNPAAEAYVDYAKPGNIFSGNDGEIYIYAQ